MLHLVKSSLVAIIGITFIAGEASAQYYNPAPAPHSYAHQPGGLGLDLGLRNNGFNPNAGFGIGPVGAGVGTGIGTQGIGLGANTGIGPLGVSTDGGLGRNGLGARAAAGIGNTGASLEGGLSRGGLGLGASAKVLNVGAGASLGIGDRGPGLGASLAFGSLGTLLIGSHRNSYPGAAQTAAYTNPNQRASYYTQQNYGNPSYYQAAPVQRPNYTHRVVAQPQKQYVTYSCPVNWTC